MSNLSTKSINHSAPADALINSQCGIIGNTRVMLNLFDLIKKIADDDFSTVLILGESGTGKELVAKAIHNLSKRAKNHFVPVNCAAIPDDLLESELFGYTKGAFTGATHNKTGRIEYADNGTLFLDEIGDMKPALQAKLLRVLQEKEFEPVGALKATPVNTRVVAATHCDLEQLVNEGTFREDLYYRLSVIPVQIPSLRQRLEDIPLLIENFIHTVSTRRGKQPLCFADHAMAALLTYEWKGNVRELENLVQHMSVLYSAQEVQLEDLPDKFTAHYDKSQDPGKIIPQPSIPQPPSETEHKIQTNVSWNGDDSIDFNELINDFETQLILKAMRQTNGNKKEAAKILNLKRTTLLEKIKKKNLQDAWKDS